MPPGEPTIAELLARARAGDTAALDALFARCRGYVRVVAQAQVESWLQAKADASDLVQQTLLEAHRDFAQFRGATQGEWLAWLRRVLAQNATDLVRRFHGAAQRDVSRELALRAPGSDGNGDGALEPADRADSPSAQAMRHERELLIADALDKLTPEHREVLALRNLQRLDFAEVARRMNRSRPAVQMLWARAVRKLREALPPE